MNDYPPWQRGGGDFAPMYLQHHDGAHPLEWAIFALLVLLVLMVGSFLLMRLAGGRPHRWGRGPRGMAFAGPGRFGPGRFGPGRMPDPLELLRLRYARGELSRDEFLQATGDLTAPGPTPEPPPAQE